MLSKLIPFLPSPTVALVFVLALLGACGWSYHFGDSAGFNRAEAARASAADATTNELRYQLAAQREQAVSESAKRGEAVAKADAAKASLSAALRRLDDVKNKPSADCVPADWRVSVNAAIDSINLALPKDGTGSVPNSVPATSTVGK